MRIGIDLGGTKTEIICLHDSNSKEIYRQRVPSPKDDYQATIKNIAMLVRQAESTLGEKGSVGVAIPGTISSVSGLVKNACSIWLNDHPLHKDLEAALGRPVRAENDANCFAVSEAIDGAAAGKKTVFGVIIGTGSGAGLVINGKSVSGLNGLGGEWGHNPLPFPRVYMKDTKAHLQHFDKNLNGDVASIYKNKSGTPEYFTNDWAWNEYPGQQCYCGKRGCIETWLSGTGFKADYARVTGEELSTHDIIANAGKGEAKAAACLNRYIDRMARSLAYIINIYDPDAIVLGGGMSNVFQLYETVPKIWDRYIFSDTCDTKLLPPLHGDSSGVRGAAWLWGPDEKNARTWVA